MPSHTEKHRGALDRIRLGFKAQKLREDVSISAPTEFMESLKGIPEPASGSFMSSIFAKKKKSKADWIKIGTFLADAQRREEQ